MALILANSACPLCNKLQGDELEKQSAHVWMTRKPADRIALSISRHCFFLLYAQIR